MSLGVLNNISALYATNTLNQTQASLQKVLQQLSSGSRINSGADDAAGLAVSNGLGGNIAALNQSTLNATEAVGLLQTADGALSQVTTLLNRAVTLATESANTTLNSTQVSAANQEYQNILSEINNIGSTTNYNGNNVFSAAATTFLVSDGTAAGSNVFSDSVGTLSTSSVGQTAATAVSTTVPFTNPTAVAPAAATAATQGTSTLTFGAASDVTTAGSTLTIGLAGGALTTINAVSQSATAIAASINANGALSSQGITATIAGGVITVKGPANGSAALNFGATSLLDFTTSSSAVPPTSVTTAVAAVAATGGTASFSLSNSTDTVAGTLSLQVSAGGTAHAITVKAGTTLSQLANQINGDTTYATNGVSASYNSTTGALLVSAIAGSGSNTLVLTGTTLTDTSVPQAGQGVNFTALSVSTLSQGTAQAVLIAVTNAIQDVAYQRGTVGANSNQLTAASTVAASEAVNLTAAQTNIQSTNYGEASSALAKYEVLSQTGISALAQANTVQQEVLKLLQ